MNIRVCTWNIGGGLIRSNRNIFEIEDLGYFHRSLAEIDADIVCVQEAHSNINATEDQITQLAAGLRLPNVVSKVLSRSHLKPSTNANIGVATRLRVLEHQFLQLPNPKWLGRGPDGAEWITLDKGFLTLILEIKDQRLCLITGHDFPIRAFGRSEDDPQLLTLHRELNDLISISGEKLPTIFSGDLNLQQPTRCIPDLQEPLFRRVIPSGPTTQPWLMEFDHIYASSNIRKRASGVLHGEADHFLCWADLTVEV